ncbi:GH3 family domain-containing protein [Thiolapillus sp.]
MTALAAWQILRRTLRHVRRDFLAQTRDLPRQQQAYLHQLLQRQADTDFGRRHGFADLRGIEAYRQAVPVQDAAQVQAWVGKISPAHPQVLSADTAFLEITGGSSGGIKYIPYGPAGMADFQAALFPWLDDLLDRRPAIMEGPAYWSISPALGREAGSGKGLPVGLENDALYFGEALAGQLARTLAVPPSVGRLQDRREWQRQTLLHLLRNPELRLASVWSPTFLLNLLDGLEALAPALLAQLDRESGQRLERALADGRVNTRVLWPRLDTISCWTHGHAGAFVPALEERFPQARIQPKGLLATEGVVSLPLEDAPMPVLAARSGFFEFLDEDGGMRLAWELEQDGVYEVVMSNNLGLYRYRLGDRVQMTGEYRGLPMLRFLGRGARQVDLCGEKLDEAFVARVLEGHRDLALLMPLMQPRPHYVCIAQSPLEIDLEKALQDNPQYAYARRLGQLAELRIKVHPGVGKHYLDWRLEQGQRLGDIKPLALLPDDAFLHYLEARA